MQIPKNEKRKIDITQAVKIFVYGVPNIGKTTFANDAPNALLINTDGNIKYVDSPYIMIKDEIDERGKVTKTAWEVFVDLVETLLTEPNDYETYVVDLVDDIYQHCRVHYQGKMKIEHESDSKYSKAWDIVRTAFFVVMRKLALSGKNIVFISYEKAEIVKDRLERETTVYHPNLPEAVYTRLSGMMEATGRIKSEPIKNASGDTQDMRVLSLSNAKDEFCGTKIKTIKTGTIPLSWNNFVKAIGGETFEDSISEQTEVARDSNPETGGRTERTTRDSSSRRAVR